MNRFAPVCVLMVACGDARSGIAVGNPGQGMTLRVESPAELRVVGGELTIDQVEVSRCDGEVVTDATIYQVVLGEDAWLPLPEGDLCGVTVTLDGPLHLFGSFVDDTPFDLSLDVPQIAVASATAFDAVEPMLFVLGPGPWLMADALEGAEVIVPGDAGHDALASQVADGSFLCEDLDGDGIREIGDQILAWGSAISDSTVPPAPSWQSPNP